MTDYITIPDFSTWQVLTDTGPTASWTPPMVSGKKYFIDCTQFQRTKKLILSGGSDCIVYGADLTNDGNNGDACITIDPADQDGATRYIVGTKIHGGGGSESDCIRTRSGADNSRLFVKHCRLGPIRGQTDSSDVHPDSGSQSFDDFGNPSGSTHADLIQLAGGIKELRVEDTSGLVRYAGFQLQREQVEQNVQSTVGKHYGHVTAAPTRNVNIATYQLENQDGGGHGLSPGEFVQIGDGVEKTSTDDGVAMSPGGWNGTFMVISVPAANKVTVDLGDQRPSAATHPTSLPAGVYGTWKPSVFTYEVGTDGIILNRINLRMLSNDQQYITNRPGEAINAWRVGARPDFKGFEDKTTMTRDGYPGDVLIDEFYIELYNSGIASLINPGSGGSVFSGVRASVVGNQITYPNWPNLTCNAFVGPPPNGDFCPAWLAGRGYPGAPGRRA